MIIKLFSIKALRRRVSMTLKRFPVPSVCLMLLTIWALFLIFDLIEPSEKVVTATSWCLCLGLMMSLAINIWTEAFVCIKHVKLLLLAAAVVVVGEYAFLLSTDSTSLAGSIGRLALMTALAVAVVFLPGGRGLDKLRMYTYTVGCVKGLIMAVAMALVCAAGIGIIDGTAFVLFHWEPLKLLYTCLLLFSGTVPAFFALSCIPRTLRKISEPSLFFGKAIKNIILPLAAVYMLLLYVYGSKILFDWNLPNGTIVWSVTGLSVVVLLVLYGIQPLRAAGDSLSCLACRLLPPLMLPLLGLMAVGLIYRFGQYGFTASRVYVAIFALWAVAVFIYLTVKNNANLNLIASTFAATFVLVSIIPGINVTSLVNRSVLSSVTPYFAGIETPEGVGDFVNRIDELPDDERELLVSRIVYLDHSGEADAVKALLAIDSPVSAWCLRPNQDDSRTFRVTVPNERQTFVPAGFGKVESLNRIYYLSADSVKVRGYAISIPADSIIEVQKLEQPLLFVPNDSVAITITELEIYSLAKRNNIKYIGGFIFTK